MKMSLKTAGNVLIYLYLLSANAGFCEIWRDNVAGNGFILMTEQMLAGIPDHDLMTAGWVGQKSEWNAIRRSTCENVRNKASAATTNNPVDHAIYIQGWHPGGVAAAN